MPAGPPAFLNSAPLSSPRQNSNIVSSIRRYGTELPVFLSSTRRSALRVLPELSNCKDLPFRVAAEAGKGFGTKKQPAKQQKKTAHITGGGEEAVKRAIDIVDGGKARPVDAKEAAKGRLDRVKVKNWGSGKPKDLGRLEVESFESDTEGMPFCKRLEKRLLQIDPRHEAQSRQDAKQKPLPPFERWSFNMPRYLQYLCDLQAVHHALESCIAEAIAVDHGDAQMSQSVVSALECFSEARGLDRSLEIAADLNNLDHQGPEALDSSFDTPSPKAAEYAQYIGNIGHDCVEAASGEARARACIRLMAHAYVIHLSHMSAGTRICSAASEKLNLFAKHATNAFTTYPPTIKNPLQAFLNTVNIAGESLNAEQQEQLMAELPSAIPVVSQLMHTLAHDD